MKIIEHETPAGPHEFGDSMITIALTHEEYDAFVFALENAEAMDAPKPLVERVAEAFANQEQTKRALIARAAGVDPKIAQELGY